MPAPAADAALFRALGEALRAQGFGGSAPPHELQALPDTGLAHHHVRLVGQQVLARIPKQSQMGLPREANLRYQAACFTRAAASGHAPRLVGQIAPGPPGTPLERGALLVEEIVGVPARLPRDLPALVANVACVGCHSDGSGYRSPIDGKELKTPHGGTFGYPVTDGRWIERNVSQAEWSRKQLPGLPSQFSLKEQFHLIHVAGRQQGRSNCTDCHAAGFESATITQGVRESCAGCHGNDSSAAAAQNANARLFFADKKKQLMGSAMANGPLCVSCHSQHGEDKDLRASLRRMEK